MGLMENPAGYIRNIVKYNRNTYGNASICNISLLFLIMTQELRNEALEQIQEEVKFGFDTEDVIVERVLDVFYNEEDIDEAWIKQQINLTWQQHQAESRQWKKPTDFDKLAIVFDSLLLHEKIICLHYAGNTRQEGISDCLEVYEDLKQQGFTAKGYCFYHMQDMQRVINPAEQNLWLGFDSIEEDSEAALAAGNTIARALRKQGFTVNWPENIDTRIEIQNVNWQKVPDDQPWRIDRPAFILQQSTKPKAKPKWKFW